MLWAAGPGEGNVQGLCCNMQSPTPAEERACHRVVTEPHHSGVIFHHHVDVTEDKCTVREDPPDPTNFPAPFNSLENASNLCVCVSVVLLRSGRAFGGHHQQKAYRGWKLGCHREEVTWSPVMQGRPLELLPPSLSCTSLLSLPWGGWFLRSTSVASLCTVRTRWLSHLRFTELGRSAVLCTSHVRCLLGITEMGDANFTSTVLLRSSWQSESCQVKVVDGGWSIPSLPTPGSTLPDLWSSWVTGAHAGSFLKGHSRAGALPRGKGCRQNLRRAAQHPTAILSAIAEQSRSLRMTDVTVYYRRITQYLYPEMHKLWEAAKLRWLLLV